MGEQSPQEYPGLASKERPLFRKLQRLSAGLATAAMATACHGTESSDELRHERTEIATELPASVEESINATFLLERKQKVVEDDVAIAMRRFGGGSGVYIDDNLALSANHVMGLPVAEAPHACKNDFTINVDRQEKDLVASAADPDKYGDSAVIQMESGALDEVAELAYDTPEDVAKDLGVPQEGYYAGYPSLAEGEVELYGESARRDPRSENEALRDPAVVGGLVVHGQLSDRGEGLGGHDVLFLSAPNGDDNIETGAFGSAKEELDYIGSGGSGGPIYNSAGEVMGVLSAGVLGSKSVEQIEEKYSVSLDGLPKDARLQVDAFQSVNQRDVDAMEQELQPCNANEVTHEEFIEDQ